MKNDKFRVNILVISSLLSTNVWLSVQLCSFLPLHQWKATLEKRRHGQNTIVKMLFMPQIYSFAVGKAAAFLVLFSLATDCHESCFSLEISADDSLICISNFILLNNKCMSSMCRCCCSLGLSLHLHDPEAGYEGWISTSNQLSFPQICLTDTSHHLKPASLSEKWALQMIAWCVENIVELEVKLHWLSALHSC